MFIDSNIFIHAYKTQGVAQTACKNLLLRILAGEINAHTSVLVLNEVHYFFLCEYGVERANSIFRNILNYKNLEVLAIDKKILEYVPGFTKDGLETSDAFHAASMQANGISTVCSYDKGFDKVKGLKRQEPK